MKIKNITLDSYELNNLVRFSYGSKSNDHLKDMIINNPLEFVRYYSEALKQQESGAFLIILPDKYILAKNCDDGIQGHILSVTKAFLELEGKNSDVSILEASRIYNDYRKKFLIFDIEIKKDEIFRKTEKDIRTIINHSKISIEEYEMFKSFFEEYKDVFDKCNFEYNVWDKESGKVIYISDIYELNNYLKSIASIEVKPNQLETKEKVINKEEKKASKIKKIVKYFKK